MSYSKVFSQDILGGEMFINPSGPNAFSFNVYLYTKISAGITRSFVHLNTGSGYGQLPLTSQMNLSSDTRLSLYSAHHTFMGPGTYSISVLDSFRIANIINVPNSGNEPFFLSYNLVIDPFGGNSSSLFQHYQTEITNNNGVIYHDAVSSNPNGDSLSYSLAACNTNGYSMPSPGSLSIDSVTENFTWDGPVTMGYYQVCINVTEWKNNVAVGENIRDMVIDVASLTGVNQLLNGYNYLTLYPNPARDIITLHFNSPTRANEIIQVYNSIGEMIIEQQIKQNCLETLIDIGQLRDGIYLCRLVSEKNVPAIKFIKL